MEVMREAQIQFERVKQIPHAFRIKNRTDAALLEHPLCTRGEIYLQGLASMVPPLILDPQPNERVLDVCAAPGSKTSQMAAMMGHGELVAVEENGIRVQKLRNTLAMQRADWVEVREEDGTLLHKTHGGHFDKVLADVPCSAEGRIDVNDPRSYGFWTEMNIVAHAKLQRRLLKSAIACLKPGGVLVYSTCTLAPEENELMVDWVLSEFPNMKTERVSVPLSAIRPHANGSVTILPTDVHEGFFTARLRKEPELKQP